MEKQMLDAMTKLDNVERCMLGALAESLSPKNEYTGWWICDDKTRLHSPKTGSSSLVNFLMGPVYGLQIWIEPGGEILGKKVPKGYNFNNNQIKFNGKPTGWFVERGDHSIFGPEYGRLPWMKEAWKPFFSWE